MSSFYATFISTLTGTLCAADGEQATQHQNNFIKPAVHFQPGSIRYQCIQDNFAEGITFHQVKCVRVQMDVRSRTRCVRFSFSFWSFGLWRRVVEDGRSRNYGNHLQDCQCHNPEDQNLNSHNLVSHASFFLFKANPPRDGMCYSGTKCIQISCDAMCYRGTKCIQISRDAMCYRSTKCIQISRDAMCYRDTKCIQISRDGVCYSGTKCT
jgi:hypothetical protein